MSLTFGAATSDRVVVTAATSINDLPGSAFSVALRIYPTTLTTDRRIISKFITAGLSGWLVELKNTDKLQFFVGRATTNTTYQVSTALTTNAWWWVFITYDSAATPTTHIYMASGESPVVEPTYGTSTDGSGAVEADATSDLHIGNLSSSSTVAFQGRIATVMLFNRVLSLGECRMLQANPQLLPSTRIYAELGFNATAQQRDLSSNRNHGTVTGATVSGHPYRNTYLPQVDEWWQGYDGYGPWPQYRRTGKAPAGVTLPMLERGLRGVNRGMNYRAA